MRTFIFFSISILLFSCQEEEKTAKPIVKKLPSVPKMIEQKQFQELIDQEQLKGSILIYNLNEDSYYSNDFSWAHVGRLPASTFKIANSIVALETGVVDNDSTLFKWDRKRRRLKAWEQDLIFRDAFHLSCVPCYQEIARKIGVSSMQSYLEKFEYGKMVVDSSNIDLFWLEGESKISQFEQISFLKKFYLEQLPISNQTNTIMKRLMVIEKNEHFTLSGKTGWAIRNDEDNGWFVGYVETKKGVFFFATNVSPQAQFDLNNFPKIRKAITRKAFQILGIIQNS